MVWRTGWLLLACTLMPVLRVKVRHFERVPQQGGALMLANHATVLDFMMPLWAAWRPVFAVGTEDVFRIPVAGWLLRQFNGAPISKGVKDRGAVLHLVRAYEDGQMAFMFPEGQRSWTGRPVPIKPGTGRLVKRLGCPVVICKITTGFLQHPRWARWPRWVPWVMEFEEPVRYPEDATVEEINADIARRMTIDPDEVEVPRGAFGWRLAEGLPAFMWACPACFAVESLSVPADDRNRVGCTACARSWRVDVGTRMNPDAEGEPAWTVATARDRVNAHFGVALDAERFAAEGIALETTSGGLSRVYRHKRHPEPFVRGRLWLAADGLRVEGAEGLFFLPFTDLVAVMLQFRSKLHLRTADTNYELDVGAESTHKWHFFVMGLIAAAGHTVRE